MTRTLAAQDRRASLDELRRESPWPEPLDDPAIQIGTLAFGEP